MQKASAFYAPATAGIEMAESYIKNLKKTLPCAAFLNGEYGVKNLYAGVPVIIGSKGVEKVIEIDLGEEEKRSFENSIKSVTALFDAAKKNRFIFGLILNEYSRTSGKRNTKRFWCTSFEWYCYF